MRRLEILIPVDGITEWHLWAVLDDAGLIVKGIMKTGIFSYPRLKEVAFIAERTEKVLCVLKCDQFR